MPILNVTYNTQKWVPVDLPDDNPDMGWPWCMAVSPNGQFLACSFEASSEIKVWNLLEEPHRMLSLYSGQDIWRSIAWSQDSTTLFSGGKHHIAQWSIQNPNAENAIVTISVYPEVANLNADSITMSCDGLTLAIGCETPIRLLNLRTKQLELLPDPSPEGRAIVGVLFSSDGRFLAQGVDDIIYVWSLESGTGTLFTTLKYHQASQVRSFDFAPTGHYLIVGYESKIACIWDLRVRTDKIAPSAVINADSSVWSVAFSPDGKEVLVGTYGGQLSVFDLSGKPLAANIKTRGGSILQANYSPGGDHIAAGCGSSLSLWQRCNSSSGESTWEEVNMKANAQGNNRITQVDFHPDNGSVLTSDELGYTRIWSPKTTPSLYLRSLL